MYVEAGDGGKILILILKLILILAGTYLYTYISAGRGRTNYTYLPNKTRSLIVRFSANAPGVLSSLSFTVNLRYQTQPLHTKSKPWAKKKLKHTTSESTTSSPTLHCNTHTYTTRHGSGHATSTGPSYFHTKHNKPPLDSCTHGRTTTHSSSSSARWGISCTPTHGAKLSLHKQILSKPDPMPTEDTTRIFLTQF